jgi:hypothetical protein
MWHGLPEPKCLGLAWLLLLLLVVFLLLLLLLRVNISWLDYSRRSIVFFFFFFSLLTTKVHHYPLFACCLFGSAMVCQTQVPWVWQPCLMSDPRVGVADPNAGLAYPTKLGSDMIVRPKHLECGMVCQIHGV